MAYKHGVYVSEQDTSLTAPVSGTAGLQVIVGTAPINLADDPNAAVNTPILVNSFAEAKAAVGYSDDFDSFTLCQSIDASFRVFATAPVVLINVLDPAKHKKDITESTITVNAKQAVLAETGVLLSTLTVKDGTTSTEAYVNGTDYVATFDDYGHVVITMLATGTGAAATSLKVTAKAIDPSAVTAVDIVGGVNASGVETGLEIIRQIYPKLGVTAGIILAPGWSQNATVSAAIQGKTTGINGCFSASCVVDVDSSSGGATKYSDVKTAKEAQGLTSPHCYAVWPKFKVGSKTYWASAIAGALISSTDASNGDVPSLSPSNKAMAVTATVLADGSSVLLDQEQANAVNAVGVATALNMNGFRLWGNNSAAYPATSDPKDRWFCVRRFFDWRANSLILTYFGKVDSPANYRLIENIVDSENLVGNGYVNRGFCAGYRVAFNEEENPTTAIRGGTILFHIYMAPYTPAEDIEFLLEFDPTALETALNGG